MKRDEEAIKWKLAGRYGRQRADEFGRFLRAAAGDLGGELGAGADVELGEDVDQVGLHGPPRDVQPGADLRVG